MEKEKKQTAMMVGILIAFGIPGIFWVYLDWKAALTAFIVSQLIIGLAKLSVSKGE